MAKWILRIFTSLLLLFAGALVWTLSGNRERLLLAGSFHSVAHKGSGDARVVSRSDGSRVLRLLNVKTYPAPELEVCLVGAPDAEDNDTIRQAGLVCLGSYGAENHTTFPLPSQLDLHRYRAVAIWNRAYQVNFTTAPLAP